MGDFAVRMKLLVFLVLALGSASKFVDGMASVREKFEANQIITREMNEICKNSTIEKIPYIDDLSDRIDAINDRFAVDESAKCELEKRLAAMDKRILELEQKPITPTDQDVDPITGLKWSSILGGCIAPKDANGWILLMQRDYRAKNSFTAKKWNDYKNGFQEAGNAYWLGLQKMHEKTSKGKWEFAFVYQGGCKGQNPCVVYNDFKVDSENTNFKLYFGPKVKSQPKTFLGLDYNNKMPFTTVDRENDAWSTDNCAKYFGGGWWHGSGCFQVCPTCTYSQPGSCNRSYIAMKNLK